MIVSLKRHMITFFRNEAGMRKWKWRYLLQDVFRPRHGEVLMTLLRKEVGKIAQQRSRNTPQLRLLDHRPQRNVPDDTLNCIARNYYRDRTRELWLRKCGQSVEYVKLTT